ncbi:MAG: MFS transporter [Alphaproteobacteria bacterium]|nr:MFS transporter [Alphaproteobacteria bacterium]
MASARQTDDLGSLRTKLFYGFGSVAYGVKDQGFTTLLMLFYNQIVGLPAAMVGTAILIALVFDSMADPIVGQISDNLRSRWGRRHPFMYASAIPVAIFYWFLWNPPAWSHEALFAYLVVMAIVVRTFITMYEIPSSALAAELSDDYDQRTSFMAFRFFFGWQGALAMTLLGFAVFFKPDASHPVGQLNPAGYSTYAFYACLVMVVAIFVSALGTHKFIPRFTMPPKRKITLRLMLHEMKQTFSNRSFAALTASTLFAFVAAGTLAALGVYFDTYFWHLSAQEIALRTSIVVLAPFIALSMATPLSRTFDKKNSAILLFIASLILFCTPFTLRLLDLFPENGSPWLIPALMAFALVTTTLSIACGIMGASMMTDVVEDSQIHTGRRSEGLFFAATSLVQKAVSGLGAFIAGLLLALVQFPANAAPATLDPAIIHRLVLVFLPTVAILFSLSILCLCFYRIGRATHAENLRRLAEKTPVTPADPEENPDIDTAGAQYALASRPAGE